MGHALTYHEHHNTNDNDIFGFWIYILSDCILFACLFATFAVLHTNVYGGPGVKELTNLSYILKETFILLASSFTYGLAILALYKNKIKWVLLWLAITSILGFMFVDMEINEFINLYSAGHGWQASAALSAFFTLVGTHGFHVMMGLLWMMIMMIQLITFGPSSVIKKRLTYLGLFWAFLDIVWIFVFTIVYLMEAI